MTDPGAALRVENRLIESLSDYTSQPFFVLDDVGYNRMLHKLQNGSRFEWSYLHTCPHTRKEDCKCVKYMNVLHGDKIVRIINNTQKPVLSSADYLYLVSS